MTLLRRRSTVLIPGMLLGGASVLLSGLRARLSSALTMGAAYEERGFLAACALVLLAQGGRAVGALAEAWRGPYARDAQVEARLLQPSTSTAVPAPGQQSRLLSVERSPSLAATEAMPEARGPAGVEAERIFAGETR